MNGQIDFDVDLTASHAGHELRIQGDQDRIVVNAEAWSPLLKARKLQSGMKSRLPDRSSRPLSVEIKVRSSKVCTIRTDTEGTRRTVHPLGILRSLFSRG